ncbi:MAG: N-acetyltransferase [Sphingomonadaceae bacterium]|nr:N-acetyltransferase [Sphingomonadaceae bacterium]
MVELKPLHRAADAAVENLLDQAFGTDRFTRTAYRVRAGLQPLSSYSFSAWDGDVLVGALQSWPVALAADDGSRHPLIMVGPVAVSPTLQRGGMGKQMMAHLLTIAEDAADCALMLVGDAPYYSRFFGFDTAATSGWRLPGPFDPARLLARPIGGHLPPDLPGLIVGDPQRR